ncbi:MAG: hypothetical protein GVY34_10170 [Alphaproteobacteria bacterium]|jgi:hypothetical protein|nr:hypothetical protein [Alphaproteobacteria bacterium]
MIRRGAHIMRAAAMAVGLATVGQALAAQTQAEVNDLLRGTPDIYNGLFTAALVKHIADSCEDSIDPPGKLARVTYFLGLYSKARALGPSRAQIEAFVEDKGEQDRMRQLVYTHLRAADVDPLNEQAVCAYASDQIAQGTALGQRLREK